MKIGSRHAISLLMASLLLSACVPVNYRVDGATYTNRDEAWAAVLRSNAETESGIAANAAPLSQKKLLMVIPTAAAFLKYIEAHLVIQKQTFPSPGTPQHAEWAFLADKNSQYLKSVASSIRKANIYREVAILDANSTMENIQPSPDTDVLIPSVVPGGGSTWYYSSVKDGKQVLPIDEAHKERLDRRKSMIDALKAKALQ